jgi:hypothetical protein
MVKSLLCFNVVSIVKEEQYNTDDCASNFYRGGAKTRRNAKKTRYFFVVLCVLAISAVGSKIQILVNYQHGIMFC